MRKNDLTLAWLNHLLDPWIEGLPPVAPPSGLIPRWGELYKVGNEYRSDRTARKGTRMAWSGGLHWGLFICVSVDLDTEMPDWRSVGRRVANPGGSFFVFDETDAKRWVCEGTLPPGFDL